MEKILIVDDESDIEVLIKQRFKKEIKEGLYQFFFAMNGQEALDILEKQQDVNIILTDISMPIMDGLSLLQNLPKLNRPYKAIVVSAYGDMSNIRIAMNRGAADFIMKPIDFVDFEVTLKKIIEDYTTLSAAINAEKNLKAIQMELDIARSIQQAMLPSNFHPFPNSKLEIAAQMIPARVVGGDFYDFFAINDNQLAIVIADVSGKSLSACLYMSVTRSLFRAFIKQNISAKELMTVVDHFLSAENVSGMFVTAFFAVLDISTGQLTYCNAGHNPPYIIQRDKVEKIPTNSGYTLGIKFLFGNRVPPFEEKTLSLNSGDCLFCYTDGITEAWNQKEELFSEQRLEETLNANRDKSAEKIMQAVIRAVNAYNDTGVQSDDLAILAVRYQK